MNTKGRRLALAVWLGTLAACAVLIFHTRFVADLSAFMPSMPSERQQLLVEQLRDGMVARLVMVGVEGGDSAQRARLSRELATHLRASPAFTAVQNGDAGTRERDRAYFFDNRFLLSPTVTAERFTSDGLRRSIGNSIDALAGDAGLVLKQLLPRDPTAETLQLIEQFAGESQPRSLDGAWASRDGRRALLLVQVRAAGTDTEAQSQALQAIRQTFEQLKGDQADARLVMSGTSVFAVSSRNTIESEVRRLAIASSVLVIGLLLVVYRSVTLLLLGLLPVVSGAVVGVAAVSLGFGHVHALTLGFGTTLIGEAVDYSIYLFIQRSGGMTPKGFWRTIRLGVLTSVSGFAVLVFSGFPGLSQLGLYSIGGLLAAALVTRYVLPLLMSERFALRDLSAAGRLLDHWVGHASRLQWLVLTLLVLAGGSILYQRGSIWNRQLSALSPISAAEQALDQELRNDLGASDMRYIATFTAANEEAALREAERAGAVLDGLVRTQTLAGFNSPAFVLPSVALQRTRQAALPDAVQTRARLQKALVDLPLRAERLEGFVEDLQTARQRPPLVRADLAGTSAAFLLDSLLIKREDNFLVLMPLRALGKGPAMGVIDLPKVNTALQAAGLSKVVLIDLLEETTHLFESYLHEALMLSGMGCLAIIALLLATLRSFARTLRVVIPLACSVLCVTAVLLASGIQLTIFHLIGLLLVVAVGSNYALFFDGGAQSPSESDRRQTQVSLLVANLTTVSSFGVLGLSQVPVLNAIGMSVGLGAFLALVFSAIFARSRSHAYPG